MHRTPEAQPCEKRGELERREKLNRGEKRGECIMRKRLNRCERRGRSRGVRDSPGPKGAAGARGVADAGGLKGWGDWGLHDRGAALRHYGASALRGCGVALLRHDRPTAEGSLCAGNHDCHCRTPAPDMSGGPGGPDAGGLIGWICSIGLAGFCFLELPCDGGSLKIATHILF